MTQQTTFSKYAVTRNSGLYTHDPVHTVNETQYKSKPRKHSGKEQNNQDDERILKGPEEEKTFVRVRVQARRPAALGTYSP